MNTYNIKLELGVLYIIFCVSLTSFIFVNIFLGNYTLIDKRWDYVANNNIDFTYLQENEKIKENESKNIDDFSTKFSFSDVYINRNKF